MSIGGTMAQEKKKILTLWEWHMVEVPEIVGKLYEDFEQRYNVDLVVETLGFPELPKKILMAAKAGTMPDLVEIFAIGVLPVLVEEGILEPLGPYIEREPGGKEKFLSQYLDYDLTYYKGKIYSLPIYDGSWGLFYNKDMFKEAGIDQPPKTWDELVATAVKLTIPEKGQWGLALDGGDNETLNGAFANFILQNGGRIGIPPEYGRAPEFEVSIKDIGINKPEAVEAIKFVIDLINKYKVVPAFVTSPARISREMFAKGKAAMLCDGPWNIPIVRGFDPKFDWSIAVFPWPKGTKQKAMSLTTGDTEFAMSRSCEDKELGWKFIKFMTSKESIGYWAIHGLTVPTRKDVIEMREIKENPLLKPFLEMLEWKPVSIYSHMPPQLDAALDIFMVEIHTAVLGKKTTQEAMDRVAEEWKALWDEWREKYGE